MAATQSTMLEAIASMEKELARMKAALGVEGVSLPSKPKKAKKERDPDAPKREPNVWIRFTQRVDAALKAAAEAAKAAGDEEKAKRYGGPAVIAKQFASHLKDQKAYDAWTEEEMVTAFDGWTRPEVSKTKAKAASAAASEASSVAGDDSGSVAGSEKPAAAEKPKRVISEEQKAKMAAGRAAAKAKRDAEKAAAAAEPAAEPAAAAAEKPAEKPAAKPAAFKPKAVAKPAEKTFTLEELTDFEPVEHEGEDFGVNKRGDVVDGDGNFIGRYNAEKKALDKSAAKPADWEAIRAKLME